MPPMDQGDCQQVHHTSGSAWPCVKIVAVTVRKTKTNGKDAIAGFAGLPPLLLMLPPVVYERV